MPQHIGHLVKSHDAACIDAHLAGANAQGMEGLGHGMMGRLAVETQHVVLEPIPGHQQRLDIAVAAARRGAAPDGIWVIMVGPRKELHQGALEGLGVDGLRRDGLPWITHVVDGYARIEGRLGLREQPTIGDILLPAQQPAVRLLQSRKILTHHLGKRFLAVPDHIIHPQTP